MARKVGSVGAETADKVRLAAVSLFARYGYAAVSMRQIAREIDLQAGAIYNHFPTKQHLLRGLLVEHMERLLNAWGQQEDKSLAPAEALIAFVRFHIRYHVQCGDDVFISYMELRNLEEDNFAEVEALRRRYENNLRHILDAGATSGVFNIGDLHVATMGIIAMLTGITGWYRLDGRLSLDEIEEFYIGMIAGAVGITEA
jgi:AcrR family transcriptional regulator